MAAATPLFKQMLTAENFKTTANFSQILALSGFFARASLYLKDPSAFTFALSNEPFTTYFCTSKGFVNTLGYL